jgi:mannose-6-phosphate isomerase-like protein (cupin superfamily)
MKLKPLIAIALLTTCVWLRPAAQAQAPDDHEYFSAAELDAYAAAMAADGSAGPGRMVSEETYFAALSHRQPGSGSAESHRNWADVYFVSSGTGLLIVGGTIIGGEETGPGEIRGDSIDGGLRRTLTEGDVVHIPAGTAHHVIVAPGEQLTYVLFKIQSIK